MREIKFRAWDVKNKFMYGPYPLISMLARLGDYFNDPWEFQQYTGLHDQNGKEIYEGDIVYLAGYGNYLVEWPFIQLFESSFERDIGNVLGNAYENPKLLEEK